MLQTLGVSLTVAISSEKDLAPCLSEMTLCLQPVADQGLLVPALSEDFVHLKMVVGVFTL